MLSNLRLASKPLMANARTMALKASYENIIVTPQAGKGVSLITLNRPKALNALNDALLDDLIHATGEMDKDPEVGCIVITGEQPVFLV